MDREQRRLRPSAILPDYMAKARASPTRSAYLLKVDLLVDFHILLVHLLHTVHCIFSHARFSECPAIRVQMQYFVILY